MPKGRVELADESWMHGKISRKEAEPLLTHRGDYLVRESAKKLGELALSVKALDHDLGRDKVTHFIIQQDVPGKYRFDGDPYPSVRELLTHYREYTMAVTKRSGAKLVRAICRDDYDAGKEVYSRHDECTDEHEVSAVYDQFVGWTDPQTHATLIGLSGDGGASIFYELIEYDRVKESAEKSGYENVEYACRILCCDHRCSEPVPGLPQ